MQILSGAKMRVKRLLRAPFVLKQTRSFWRGLEKWRYHVDWPAYPQLVDLPETPNPLQAFFEARKNGSGIWKWNHYFDIYHHHFSRFRNRDVSLLEIGIYSGGSLEMWRDYFGPRCRIYGVDIEPACKAYETEFVKVFIGDQGDRSFWKHFKKEVQTLDIVIDDGSHIPEHQILTFEELLPHLSPGGVYLCEDMHGLNTFASYVYGFAHNLNAFAKVEDNLVDHERRLVCDSTPFQSAVRSIHLYPYVVVVDRTNAPISELVAPKRGNQWEPFLK